MEDADFFKKNKYIVVKNALTPREANICARAIMFDEIQRPNSTDDRIAPLTKTRYASPVTEALIENLQPLVEQKTGLSLIPTYSYCRIYKPGDYLLKHKDRVACEISLTINLGYEYITDDPNYRWNIWVDNKEFITEPGDMLIYRGIDLEHWRDKFVAKDGSWQVQAFLHWINKDGLFSSSIDKLAFDGRPGLGYLYKK